MGNPLWERQFYETAWIALRIPLIQEQARRDTDHFVAAVNPVRWIVAKNDAARYRKLESR